MDLFIIKLAKPNPLETLDFISVSLENGTPIDVVLLDFSKAFAQTIFIEA